MIFLLLGIISSASIVVLFKIVENKDIKLLPIIVYNYLVATSLGFILNKVELNFAEIAQSSWFVSGIIIGALFVVGFFLIGNATQKIGISITTISNKMSVVLPIGFSVFYFGESLSFLKIFGIIIALVAIFLSSYHKPQKDKIDLKYIYLPIGLFLAIGIMDSLVKFSQSQFSSETIPVFTAVAFGIAAIIGLIISIFSKVKISDYTKPKTIFSGILLGMLNYGSIYFLMQALEKSGLDSSIVFGINNIGVIILSVLLALIFFKERIKWINWFGIVLAITAVVIFAKL